MAPSAYPPCLSEMLLKHDIKPSFDIEWDRALLATLKSKGSDKARLEAVQLANVISRARRDILKSKAAFPDLADEAVYELHQRLFLFVANSIVLAPQHRQFVIDDDNRLVIRFLLYYFNNSPLAESVFPGRGYKLHKNILLQGGVGVGKTMIMQVFSEYLRRTNNPRFFYNVSVTQMVNYYSIHNNIDRFLYNETSGNGFQGRPVSLCLNDIGVDNRPFYGVDTLTIVNDFLHARNEIWSNQVDYDGQFAHLTTNLTNEQLTRKFSQKDEYGRIIDRFKTYNVIPLPGQSRR